MFQKLSAIIQPLDTTSNTNMASSTPIPGTIISVPAMPSKLVVFKVKNSKFWWTRVYMNNRYYTKSTKTTVKRQAFEAAKQLYNDALIGALNSPKAFRKTALSAIATKMLEIEKETGKKSRHTNDKCRINKMIIPYFQEQDINQITTKDIAGFVKILNNNNLAPATKKNYLSLLHKIFSFANGQQLIQAIPVFPKLNEPLITAQKRDWLEVSEYKKLNSTIRNMARQKVKFRGLEISEEMAILVNFMINSFIRPSDLKILKHNDITRQEDKKENTKWLVLTHNATKTNAHPMHSMPRAVDYYDKLLKFRQKNGQSCNPNDYVFYPQYSNRETFISTIGKAFKYVVENSELKQSTGKRIVLYSLRHTSIMLRLIKGNIDTLSLALNARTSQGMIEKYYASHLTTAHTRKKLHSFN